MANTTSNISKLLSTYYVRKLMKIYRAKLRYHFLFDTTNLPRFEGTTAVWNAMIEPNDSAMVSANLGEGVKPASFNLSARQVSATLIQLGRWVKITDLVDTTAIQKITTQAVGLLGAHGVKGTDSFLRSVVFRGRAKPGLRNTLGNTSTFCTANICGFQGSGWAANANNNTQPGAFGFQAIFAGSNAGSVSLSAAWGGDGAANEGNEGAGTASRMSISAIRSTVVELQALNAEEFDDGHWRSILHPRDAKILKESSGYAEWYKHTSNVKMLYKGEIGVMDNVRFMMSTQNKRHSSNSLKMAGTPIVGTGALGMIPYDFKIAQPKVIFKTPGPNSTDNPLDQWSSVGTKQTVAGQVLNPSGGRILMTMHKTTEV